MRIHVTYTGGTIGMVQSEHGLVPGADLKGWLYHLLEGTRLDNGRVSITELDPLIDSSNATPDNWQAIIDDLWAHRDDADAFVVLHGTDTMSYSAAALSYALTEFGKPVILTGSQNPLGTVETDATANVTGAFVPSREKWLWVEKSETIRTSRYRCHRYGAGHHGTASESYADTIA